jgi:hypothetical protein
LVVNSALQENEAEAVHELALVLPISLRPPAAIEIEQPVVLKGTLVAESVTLQPAWDTPLE